MHVRTQMIVLWCSAKERTIVQQAEGKLELQVTVCDLQETWKRFNGEYFTRAAHKLQFYNPYANACTHKLRLPSANTCHVLPESAASTCVEFSRTPQPRPV